jgi:hypothetical protein
VVTGGDVDDNLDQPAEVCHLINLCRGQRRRTKASTPTCVPVDAGFFVPKTWIASA